MKLLEAARAILFPVGTVLSQPVSDEGLARIHYDRTGWRMDMRVVYSLPDKDWPIDERE